MGGSLFYYLSHLVNRCSLTKRKKSSQVRRVSDVGSLLGSINFFTVSKIDSQPVIDKSISLHDLQKCWLSLGLVFGWYDWLLK